MTEQVITISFEVESEAYQALSELKNQAAGENYMISEAFLVKNEQGHILSKDGFDTGVETANDTAKGGLIGGLVGILGGPLGIILGGSYGLLIGGLKDADDAIGNANIIEKVSQSIPEGKSTIIVLVQEENEDEFNQVLAKYNAVITRQDASVVAAEVEKAMEVQRQMAKDAKAKMREEKAEERKEQVEAKKQELKEKFDAFKKSHFN